MAENLALRESIARSLLGEIAPGGYVTCPGKPHHSGKSGRRDCRLKLDGAPTIFCVHSSCGGAVEEANRALRVRIAAAEGGREGRAERVATGLEGCAARPEAEQVPKVPRYAPEKLNLLASQCPREFSLDWLAARSPVPVPAVMEQIADGRATARLFLNTLYEPGERVLVFTRFYSQGDFLAVAGGDSYRLGEKPGVRAVRSDLPTAGREGCWFLTAPVTGEWRPNADPQPRLGRRHEGCVTRFPFLLLESDAAPESDWLKALAQLPLAIVALYTSGGVSVHALIAVHCDDKATFDAARDVCRAVLCPLGADGAAMTAVRLSRLPGCMRQGKSGPDGYNRYEKPRLQRLVYLNPAPEPDGCILDFLK